MNKGKAKNIESENSLSESVSGLKKQIEELQQQIGELKKVEEDLRVSEENFRDIFETVEEGIAYGTLRGKVLAINTRLEKILGLTRDKIIGRNVMRLARDFLSPENFNAVIPLLKGLVRGTPLEPFEVSYKDKVLEVTVNINKSTRRLTGTIRDVTESRMIQDELKVSEARLRRAELASRSGNWELHLDTGMMYGSVGAIKLYGVNESPLWYEQVKGIPVPECRPMMDKALDELINNGKPYDIEFKIKKADTGEIIDIHSICEFDRENRILFGSIQDITDRKKAEQVIMKNNRDLVQLLQITMELLETVEKKEMLRRILEGGVRLTELDTGVIYYLNGDVLNLEVTVPPLPEDFPDEFRKALLNNHPHIREAITANKPLIVHDILKENLTQEEKMIVSLRNLRSLLYIPLSVNKEVMGILIMGTSGRVVDFSEREIRLSRTLSNITSLTLENSSLFDNLKIAKEKAEESDRLKTAFLHNISHEIRTPLNAIIGFSGFLDQPDISDQERKEYIDIIFQSNNQLLTIINDIINISHIETGQARLKITPVNVNRVVRNLHRQFMPEAGKKHIELRIKAEHDESAAVVDTDEGKLIQILANLVSNAIKFTNYGHVEFGYVCREDHAEFYVEDTGIGIPEEEQSRIFERFYQVDKSESRTYGGTGLGLPISKGFVELLGGRIWFKSTVNSGSVFSFTIPCSKSLSSSKDEEVMIPEVRPEQKLIKSILVAEDEESNYALIVTMLRNSNYRLIRACNGQEAVDLFRQNPDVDLVLMDIKMPVKDGYEAASEILKIKPHVPVIAQTAYAHTSDRALAIEIGFVDYLSKPFDKKHLTGIIEKYLR